MASLTHSTFRNGKHAAATRVILPLLFSVYALLAFTLPVFAEVPTPSTVEAATGKTASSNPQPLPAGATEDFRPRLSIPIPDVRLSGIKANTASGYVDIPWLAEYISGTYKYAVGLASMIATVMFMVGGFQYLTAGGDKGRVDKGKERISNALVGMVLLLGAYTLLNTVNPGTVTTSALRVQTVKRIDFTVHAQPPTTVSQTVQGVPPGSPPGTPPQTYTVDRVPSATTNASCFRKTFGATDAEIAANTTTVTFLGNKVQVHKMAASDWQAAFAEMEAAPPDSPIGKWMQHVRAEPFYDGLCKKGSAYGGAYVGRLAKIDAKNEAKGKKTCDSCDLHMFGLAIDIDPCHNTLVNGAANVTDMPAELPQMMAKHKLYWGGLGWSGKSSPDFVGYHDSMHYEWHGACYN